MTLNYYFLHIMTYNNDGIFEKHADVAKLQANFAFARIARSDDQEFTIIVTTHYG